MYDIRTTIMVVGIATGLVGLGLALPTGLAFGYGYGYGVRQGYSAFNPPSKTAQGLKQSPDPIKGSLGMGLQTAEERTGMKTPTSIPQLSTGPSIQKNGQALLPKKEGPEWHSPAWKQANYVYSKSGRKRIHRSIKKKMTRAEYKKWYNDISSYTKGKRR